MAKWVFLTLSVFSFAAYAESEPSCLPDFNSLQVTERFTSGFETRYPLKSSRAGTLFTTAAVMNSVYDGEHLNLRVQFLPDAELSLPYNLYAVLVIVNGEPVSWQDLTGGCVGAGQSIFPGQVIDLLPVKVRSSGTIQIAVWGRL